MSSNLVKRKVTVNPLCNEYEGANQVHTADHTEEGANGIRIETYESLPPPACRRLAISVKVTDSPCLHEECLSVSVEHTRDDEDSLGYSSLSSNNSPQPGTAHQYYEYALCGMQWGRSIDSKKQPEGRLLYVNNMLVRMVSWIKQVTKHETDATTSSSIFSYPTNASQSMSNCSLQAGRSLSRCAASEVDTTAPGSIEMVDILLDSTAHSRNHSQYIDFEDSASLRTWGSKDSTSSLDDDDSVVLSTERSKYPRVFFCF